MEKLYQNKEWLEEQYIEKSSIEIANICNCDPTTIRRWLKNFNIPIRTQKEALNTKRCKEKISGENNPMYGKPRSERIKQKIGNTLRGKPKSEEHKRKLSEANKGHIVSSETRKKISEAQKGRIAWNKGKYCPEHSKILKQKYKNGYINPFKGKHHTDKSKNKMSYIKNGKNNPMYGKSLSPETKQKISETRKERIKNGEIEKLYREKNPNWNPNRAEVYAPYGENFYNEQLRNEMWNLQNGRDLLTGDILEWGFYSKYHHIDWNKSNDNPENHIWLNSSNHIRVHSKKKRKYYEVILQKNLQILKQGKIPKNWTKKNKEMFRQENLVQLKLPINQIIEKEWCYGY